MSGEVKIDRCAWVLKDTDPGEPTHSQQKLADVMGLLDHGNGFGVDFDEVARLQEKVSMLARIKRLEDIIESIAPHLRGG